MTQNWVFWDIFHNQNEILECIDFHFSKTSKFYRVGAYSRNYEHFRECLKLDNISFLSLYYTIMNTNGETIECSTSRYFIQDKWLVDSEKSDQEVWKNFLSGPQYLFR